MLKPNLLVCVTRLREQEREKRPAAADGELWQERYMLRPKCRVPQNLVYQFNQVFVRSIELKSFAFRAALAEYGCISMHQELQEISPVAQPYLQHSGLSMSPRGHTAKHGLWQCMLEVSLQQSARMDQIWGNSKTFWTGSVCRYIPAPNHQAVTFAVKVLRQQSVHGSLHLWLCTAKI